MMDRRILVTGGSGFIGTNLLLALTASTDPSDKILVLDISKPQQDVQFSHTDLRTNDLSIIDEFKPTHVFHLAALTNHRLCANLHNAMDINVLSTQRLFSKLAEVGGVQKIVFPSSIVLYAEHASMPLNEDTSPIDIHHNHYSFTKGLCEELCKHFRKHPYNLPILTFRLSNVYGPHQAWQTPQFPNLLPQILTQAITTKKIEIWNSTPVRDFLFVEDATDAFIKALDSSYNGIVNLGSGIGTSVGAVTTEIARHTGASVTDLGKQVSGPTNVVCDISRAAIQLGWKPSTSMKDGIAKTVAFYQKCLSPSSPPEVRA